MNSLTRRLWLTGMAASGLMRAPPVSAANYCVDAANQVGVNTKSSLPLGETSDRVSWGVAIESPALYDSAAIQALTSEKPKLLAIASALKFGALHPNPAGSGDEVWRECDDIVALAERLQVPVRGDCLTWNDWLPDWLTHIVRNRDSGWQDRLRRIYEDHFQAVFSHFQALERRSDVKLLRWCGLVNEPFNPWIVENGVAAWRKGAWLDAFGINHDGVPDYIDQAFSYGKRYGSNSVALFINEAHCDNDHFGPLVRPALLRLVDALQRSGKRVDAVGLECHLMPQWMANPASPDWRPFVAFLRELSKRNVEIYITELDVNDCSFQDASRRDELVANYMGSMVEAVLEVAAVTMITNWDFSDKYSWLRGDGSSTAVFPSLGKWASCVAHPSCPRPDLYDQALHPKPARDALADALRKRL
jgi:endo-1,4-beta-xylanase